MTATSGLGFGTCCRLIDEFVSTRPSFQCLTLIPTTRDSRKSNDTVRRLEQHLERQSKRLDTPLHHRISLQPEQLDLTSLNSIQILSTKLDRNLPQLDSIICNAGYGGLAGINWLQVALGAVTDLKSSVTWPSCKIGSVGEATVPQRVPKDSAKDARGLSDTTPALGQVFTSNIFGHYVLCHSLVPLLRASPDQGRIVFVSSIEPHPSDFDINDVQGLKSDKSYESSKRLTDILVLTSSLQGTKPFIQRFLSTPASTSSRTARLPREGQDLETSTPSPGIILADNEYQPSSIMSPKIYLCHPGICATSIVPLPLILAYAMMLVFYIARWLGSPWHTLTAYKGACAPVWLTLTDQEELEDMEVRDGKAKWGSCTDRSGYERVMRTVVEGWGLGGRMGEGELAKRKGTRPGTLEVNKEDREDFEQLGRDCWSQIEGLRVEWEARMKGKWR